MKTPAGTDCKYYYQDFMRGRSQQECRLVRYNPNSANWKPKDCAACPVPKILANNFSPDLVLEGKIKKGVLGFGRKTEVRAFCSRHIRDITNPVVGCMACAKERPGLQDLFEGL